ncbi:hypothetical protein FHU36_000213 [Nonomuraea muscovyensis]|uniref:Uncharacterized protein n=1 Tax=Nonomuraea muscovyensis TaxID=1124761 RepID=A0A7X0BVK4_9ACTN|nr:hypothetical protein [Nonomuraea muscovyensis]MBB6343704.1 hypothetical protein [Nonomuraea muscovyensis]
MRDSDARRTAIRPDGGARRTLTSPRPTVIVLAGLVANLAEPGREDMLEVFALGRHPRPDLATRRGAASLDWRWSRAPG